MRDPLLYEIIPRYYHWFAKEITRLKIEMEGTKPMNVNMVSAYRFKVEEDDVDVHYTRLNCGRETMETQCKLGM